MLKSEINGENGSKCYCYKEKRKRNFVAAPGCTDDDAAVAALPETWVPKHAGPVLANYLKSQEQNHQSILDNISKQATIINEGIDEKIRNLAESLLSHIKQNELDMNCVVEVANTSKATPLPSEERNQALKRVSELYSQRIGDMESFKRDALAVERQRSDELRILLREQFQRLVKVGHRPPRDLLHEFDQKIYEINQQLISNSRAYADLEAHLRSQADANCIRVKSDLNQLCLGISKSNRRHSALSSQRSGAQLFPHPASADERRRESSRPSVGVINEVEEFDECVSRLVQAYKTAVLKVFSGFTGKLSDLRKQLGCHSFMEIVPEATEAVDLQFMIERVIRRLSSSFQKQPIIPELLDMARHGTLKMQKSLTSLGDRLRDTYTILHDSGHLCDAHMLRSGLAQQLTLACVEDLLTSHDTTELANEVTFNIALEQLRGASDIEKLNQQYDSVMVMLERTAEMCKQHSDAEIKRLEDFMNFPEAMANILMSEFHCFLEKYPRTPVHSIGSGISLPTSNSPIPRHEPNTLRTPLPRVILQTELQELALLNWRNGFLETFGNNVPLLPDELSHHARMWVDEKLRTLHMRYSLKLVSHSIRLERVKAARDQRLAELKRHDSRLESHLGAIYGLVERLPNEASEFLSLDAPELYPFCGWVDRIQANIDSILAEEPIDPETKRLKMCSYAPRLLKHRSLFESSLDLAIESCKRQIENRIQEARISNVRIASQLVLFSQGGWFSAQEALKASMAIMRGADAIESCLSRSIDVLNHRRKHLMELVDQKLVPLHRIVEDFAKSGGKGGAVDKRKPIPNKKK